MNKLAHLLFRRSTADLLGLEWFWRQFSELSIKSVPSHVEVQIIQGILKRLLHWCAFILTNKARDDLGVQVPKGLEQFVIHEWCQGQSNCLMPDTTFFWEQTWWRGQPLARNLCKAIACWLCHERFSTFGFGKEVYCLSTLGWPSNRAQHCGTPRSKCGSRDQSKCLSQVETSTTCMCPLPILWRRQLMKGACEDATAGCM